MMNMLIKCQSILVILIVAHSCSWNQKQSDVMEYKAALIEGEKPFEHENLAKKFMVVTQGKYASQAGEKILLQGGNAIDAAIAVSFTLSVERPQSTGIGGGGFALIYDKTEVKAYDFRERAPYKVDPKDYVDDKGQPLYDLSQIGGKAVAVPGLVSGMHKLHSEYGKLPWSELLKPAIQLAEEGFHVYSELSHALEKKKDVLKKYADSRKIFFKNENEVLGFNDLLVQKDLAKTLREIAKKGKNGFYKGWVSKNILTTLKNEGSVITRHDFRAYQTKQRNPVKASYNEKFKNVEVYSMPAPSSGGIHVLQILNMVEANLKNYSHKKSPLNEKHIHYTVLAMQQAFYDRAMYLGDPDFVKVPQDLLISKEYAKKAVQYFSEKARKKDTVLTPVNVGEESFETTHFSVMDSDGMVVSSTQTINGFFGSGIVAKDTGIVLNNEMDDFALSIGGENLFGAYGGEKNFIQPKKTPLSSMSPTIVMKDAKTYLVLGTPSGTRIITCVALTLLNHLFYDLSLKDSVMLSRYHHQWSPDELWFEKELMQNLPMQKLLANKGHKIIEKELGCKIEAILKNTDGTIEGFADPRGRGLAIGGN